MPAPATSAMLSAKAAPTGIRPKILKAANTTSSSTPMAPPCRLSANTRLLSRLRHANTSAPSAAAATPARRSSGGRVNQPWSAPYLSSAATPANSTSMPIFTGTLPTVNQRCTARTAVVAKSGREGATGRGGRGGIGGAAGAGVGVWGADGIGGGPAARSGAAGAGAGVARGGGAASRIRSASVGPSSSTGAAGALTVLAGAGAGSATRAARNWATCASSVATRRFRPLTDTSATMSRTGMANTASPTRTNNPTTSSIPRPRLCVFPVQGRGMPRPPAVRAAAPAASGMARGFARFRSAGGRGQRTRYRLVIPGNDASAQGRSRTDAPAGSAGVAAYLPATTRTISRHLLE